ncbi:MAG: NERD domain-containing protein [Gammaproteobacteria bacterium]|nr:NERD domain-containing protein [Gammaproteobacteria bacterium]MDH4315267.1 NERD domain-containing protein [Gammaproteobacteria bacterium]MDH5213967.1 NERD domain-containing protein [Gammaproteobacteria bacterium]MDH5501346.1 NERD domain-containing protein [Gammaproteobacteria bacterium]
MNRRYSFFSFACTISLAARPGFAAEPDLDSQVITGVTNLGLGVFLISIAVALLLTLFFRASATHLGRIVTARLGKKRIRKILAGKSKDLLDDLILPGAYGGLTRIDHALLTSGGILCIQTKHYNGMVFGNADEPQWTNVDGIYRRKFLNPLIQNEGRCKALKKIVPDVPVANLVVFTGSVQFGSPLEKNVIHVRDLHNYIARFVFGPCKISDWDAVWLTVRAAALTDEQTRKDFGAQLGFS